jgi:glycosyltransferase involved in cell wall biosynthesis
MTDFAMVAPTASADGYGCSAEAMVLSAVRDHGADITFVGYDWVDERYTDPELIAMKRNEVYVCDHELVVVYFLPYALPRFQTKININMTMWETDKIPDTWARIINDLAEGVIVPSEHTRAVFQRDLDVPVVAVPFGTDVKLNRYIDRDGVRQVTRRSEYVFLMSRRSEYVFLMSGLLHYRKGLEFALRAFREEFSNGEPDVKLWLKTRRNFLDAGEEIETLADPRVTVIDEDYTREQMVRLYHQADCLLATSRGEGSGLTPRDAMATGLPVILTDWGGLSELADPRYSFPVPIEALEPAPAQNSSYDSAITRGCAIGNFARPSVSHIRHHMRELYEDQGLGRMVGERAARWMREEWTWRQCAEKWLKVIDEFKGVS